MLSEDAQHAKPASGLGEVPAWAIGPETSKAGRFVLGPELGRGAYGRILRAWDPLLTREVALKLLLEPDPIRTLRLCQEAQNQAKVHHPYVCPIHEVGMSMEAPYIAMPLLEGESFQSAFPRLPLEDVVRIVAEAAEGIAAAHTLGLVHRDIKPANIHLVPGADSVAHAVVLDFGLAVNARNPGIGYSGEGTDGFMSPEQELQEEVGPASDIYSLGATLAQVSEGRKGLRDLPAVVARATNPDPGDRYPSAAAFAQDLRAWLELRPVQASNPPRYRYLGAWARRNRGWVALALGAAALLIAAGAVQWTHVQRLRRTETFTRNLLAQVQDMEGALRIQRMLPPHNLTQELDHARASLKALEDQVRDAGRDCAGPGAYALGRAHLALGDAPEGLRQLQRAQAAGLEGPDFSYFLGQALGKAYQSGLLEVGRLKEGQPRNIRLKELNELRTRALNALQQGQTSRLAPLSLQKGLIALYEGNFDAAQALAADTVKENPWLYEAVALQGEILLVQAEMAKDRTQGWNYLAAAQTPVARATALAPSDSRLRELEARRCAQALWIAPRIGQDSERPYQEMSAALGAWEILEGANLKMKSLQALGLAELAFSTQYLKGKGLDSRIHKAVALSDEILKADPNHPDALFASAFSQYVLALSHIHAGERQEAMGLLNRARDLLHTLLRKNPENLRARDQLASTQYFRLELLSRFGNEDLLDTEVEAVQRSLDELPPGPGAEEIREILLARIRIIQAAVAGDNGGDPRPIVKPSLAPLARIAEHSQDPTIVSVLAGLHLIVGQTGTVPFPEAEQSLRQAVSNYRMALAKTPSLLENAWGWMLASGYLAERSLEQNPGTSPSFDDLEKSVQAMERIQPGHWSTLHGKAWLALLRSRTEPPGSASKGRLTGALSTINQALKINPDHEDLYVLKSRLLVQLSKAEPARRAQHLSAAMAVLRQAVGRFPSSPNISKEIKALPQASK